jgi:iron complex transport system substrate-binding protein
MPRIVSLIASATEIVCALGFEEHLVGRSHECDFPPGVLRLPICTEPKFDIHGTSSEIDRRVKETLRESLSVYRVHEEVLNELQPDVIVTQSQCDVCAVSLRDVEAALSALVHTHPRIVALAPNALADIWLDIQRVADAVAEPKRGRRLVHDLNERMQIIAARAAAGTDHRPTVACIEWIEPLMAAGNWMPELVELAGGVNLFGTAGKHSPAMSWADFSAGDPEVILVLPCGWGIAQARREMPVLTALPGWDNLRAVRNQQVYLTDGNQFFNRPGPRVVESLEIVAEILWPQLFQFGHEGKGWARYTA